VKLVVVAFFATSVFLFLKSRKEVLIVEGTKLLEQGLSRGTDLRVKIGSVHGHILGFISFKDVELDDPAALAGSPPVLKIKEIRLRYRFLDFLSKSFDSKIQIVIDKPVVHWKSSISLKKPEFPFFKWMRDWGLSQKSHVTVKVKNMELIYGPDKNKLSGINLYYENNAFRAEVPLSHINVASSDLSSVINVEGSFEPGFLDTKETLRGHIHTEGSVVNWKPLREEFKMNFIFTEDDLRAFSSNLLGGVEFNSRIDFTKDYDVDITLKTQGYPFINFEPFLSASSYFNVDGNIDLNLHFYGSPWAPTIEGHARLHKGWGSRKDIKALDVNVIGIYPTVRLEGSRVILEDGSVMRLADKTLEAVELFRDKTYEKLIGEAQQETVVWGDWEFSRPRDIKDQPEFLMQRVFGENTRLHLRKFNEYNEDWDTSQTDNDKVEVGLEYKLRSKDSLKLELKDNSEEFVGIERKMKF